jgi:UDP-glucose 4-epimerase
MEFRMNSVLVTGAAGMIGSHLIDILLESGAKVIGLDSLEVGSVNNLPKNERFKFIEGSVLDEILIEHLVNQVDGVVHLATLKKGNNLQESRSTLRMITKSADIIMNAAWLSNKRVVLASTSDVYGYGTSFPFVETDPVSLGPFNTRRWAYATAKQYTEQLAFDYAMDGLDVRVLRYFGGFSERSCQGWQGGHIPIFVKKILNEEVVEIHGDGSQTRCVTYGADLAKGTFLALTAEGISGELFNIGGSEEISVKDTALRIAEIAEVKNLKMKFLNTADSFGTYQEIQRRLPCLKKSKTLLNYYPTWSFDEGIKKLISSYRS